MATPLEVSSLVNRYDNACRTGQADDTRGHCARDIVRNRDVAKREFLRRPFELLARAVGDKVRVDAGRRDRKDPNLSLIHI